MSYLELYTNTRTLIPPDNKSGPVDESKTARLDQTFISICRLGLFISL